MKFLHKHKIEVVTFLGIILLYVILRLVHLLQVPLFTDEAIYIRWAQIAKNDPTWLFISLTDGKQPLFIWFMFPFLSIVKDPLIAGRLVSVFSGLLSVIGLFFLGKELFKNRCIGMVSALVYVISPFTLVYDRMALYDSMVSTVIIWALYLEVLFIRSVRLRTAVQTGLFIGIAMWVKTNAFFALYLLPFSILLFDWRKKDVKRRVIRLGILLGVIVVLSNGIYNILRISPFFYIIAQKNYVFIYSFKEWLQHPLTYLIPNLTNLVSWFISYVTWPWIVAMLGSFIIIRTQLKEKLLLLIWFVIPLSALSLFGKLLYPRYLLPMVVPLFPLIAYTFVSIAKKITNKVIVGVVIIIFCSMALISDNAILTDFIHAPIPQSDIEQFTGWASGGGLTQIISILQKQSEKGPIYVGTEGTFGLVPAGLELYLGTNKNITIKGYWPIESTIPNEALSASKEIPTYFLFYQPCLGCKEIGFAPASWPMKEVFRFHRRKNTVVDMTLYRVKYNY